MFPIQDTIPHRRPPVGMWGIIALNALIFFFELGLSPAQLELLFYHAGVVPARVTTTFYFAPDVRFMLPVLLTFVTCMFLHGGWMHFLANMWALWIFGDNVEDKMGTLRFIIFYLTCGIVATAVHVWSDPLSEVPVVGASGAISGVMGAYLLFFPTARILTVIPIWIFPYIVEIPAIFFMMVWFATQMVGGLASLGTGQTVGGVAWWAHIGGFAAGLVLAPLTQRQQHHRPLARDEGVFEMAWGRRW